MLTWLGSLISSAFAFPTPPITFSSLESIPQPSQSSFSLHPGTKPILFCSSAFDQLSSTTSPSFPHVLLPCLSTLTCQLRQNFIQRSCLDQKSPSAPQRYGFHILPYPSTRVLVLCSIKFYLKNPFPYSEENSLTKLPLSSSQV